MAASLPRQHGLGPIAGRRYWRCLVALLCLLLALPAAALELVPGREVYDLAPAAEALRDPDAHLDLSSALAATQWQPLGARSPVFGFASGAFWFRTRIVNAGNAEGRWVYVVPYALLDRLTLHILRADGRVEIRESGDRTPFDTRDLKHRHFNFLIDIGPGERVDLVLRVHTDSSVQVPQELLTRSAFLKRNHESQLGIGIYYGILLALLLVNLTLWLVLREATYGWYVAYVASFGLVQMNLNGLSFEYLWPGLPTLANLAMALSMALGLMTMSLFTRTFLDLPRNRPRLDRVFRVFIQAQAVMLVAVALLPYRVAIMIETASVFLIVPLILYAAVSLWRSGFRPAGWFLLAWTVLLLGTVAYALVSFGVLPKWFITEYGIQIGSALELTLLSFALSFRLRALEQEKQRLVRAANDELELRVARRTEELNRALDELAAANRQLHEVSRRDGLTGAYNRRFLEQSLDLLWAECRNAGEAFSVLMLDIDHFKSINDRHGHLVGDECLKAVADAAHASLRGPRECLARWGGEEFIVLLPGLEGPQAAERGEQIRAAIAGRRPPPQGPRIEMRVSIGVASGLPRHGGAPLDLVGSADQALYRAKREGRDRVVLA